jgi:hypothetical protein
MDTLTLEDKISKLPQGMKIEAELFIDFLLFRNQNVTKNKKRVPGFYKGKISISDDFDLPLDCFKEYNG